ncbi:ATP-grasp domain-containing protein [Nocardiopsis kunsanensis]|uniref:ATP-grasp domain-containing protein n=1 Tax=Nocardiopsis kunsanensis TaxID=141693 RepID=UPI00034B1FDA|nr:ATP-grasp domain-containing protein [Nocardiopsis kunsanensis]
MTSESVVVFINLRRTQLEYMPTFEAARRLGHGVALITDKTPVDLPDTIVREVVVVDTYDHEKVDAAADRIAGRFSVAGVVTWSDRDVTSVSRICARLGLPAPSVDSAETARNKYLMREAMAARPELIPRYARVTDVSELDQAREAVGFPAVLKPTSASGSKGIFVVHDEEELDQACTQLMTYTRPEVDSVFTDNPNELVLEGLLVGTEHSVEGFVHRGEVLIAGVTDKESTKEFCLETAQTHPSALPEGPLTSVQRLTETVVAEMGLDDCTFHLECIVDGTGTARLVEIAARPAGDFIASHLVTAATGVSFHENVLRVATGHRPIPVEQAHLHAGVRKVMAAEEGTFEGLEGLEEAGNVPGVRHIIVERAQGAAVRMPPTDYASSTLGAVIATGDSDAYLQERLQRATDLLRPRFTPREEG